MTTRLEHDLLGEREIPASAYWGIHTLRAIENFPITGVPIGHYRSLVRGLGFIKEASAKANLELDVIPQEIADPIIKSFDRGAGWSLGCRICSGCHSRWRWNLNQHECQ
jgi:aspartate ammonia-lyase